MARKKADPITPRAEPTLEEQLATAREMLAAHLEYVKKLVAEIAYRLRMHAERIERYKTKYLDEREDVSFAVSQTLNEAKSVTFNLPTDTLARNWADYTRIEAHVRRLEAEIEREMPK